MIEPRMPLPIATASDQAIMNSNVTLPPRSRWFYWRGRWSPPVPWPLSSPSKIIPSQSQRQARSPFLARLPVEIRQEIFSYLIPHQRLIYVSSSKASRPSAPRDAHSRTVRFSYACDLGTPSTSPDSRLGGNGFSPTPPRPLASGPKSRKGGSHRAVNTSECNQAANPSSPSTNAAQGAHCPLPYLLISHRLMTEILPLIYAHTTLSIAHPETLIALIAPSTYLSSSFANSPGSLTPQLHPFPIALIRHLRLDFLHLPSHYLSHGITCREQAEAFATWTQMWTLLAAANLDLLSLRLEIQFRERDDLEFLSESGWVGAMRGVGGKLTLPGKGVPGKQGLEVLVWRVEKQRPLDEMEHLGLRFWRRRLERDGAEEEKIADVLVSGGGDGREGTDIDEEVGDRVA